MDREDRLSSILKLRQGEDLSALNVHTTPIPIALLMASGISRTPQLQASDVGIYASVAVDPVTVPRGCMNRAIF